MLAVRMSGWAGRWPGRCRPGRGRIADRWSYSLRPGRMYSEGTAEPAGWTCPPILAEMRTGPAGGCFAAKHSRCLIRRRAGSRAMRTDSCWGTGRGRPGFVDVAACSAARQPKTWYGGVRFVQLMFPSPFGINTLFSSPRRRRQAVCEYMVGGGRGGRWWPQWARVEAWETMGRRRWQGSRRCGRRRRSGSLSHVPRNHEPGRGEAMRRRCTPADCRQASEARRAAAGRRRRSNRARAGGARCCSCERRWGEGSVSGAPARGGRAGTSSSLRHPAARTHVRAAVARGGEGGGGGGGGGAAEGRVELVEGRDGDGNNSDRRRAVHSQWWCRRPCSPEAPQSAPAWAR